MKKSLLLVMALILTVTTFASCGKKADPVDVKVSLLKGPTAMGMVKFMSDYDDGKIKDNNYEFNISASIDEITAKLSKGEIDIAALPANLASVLYNNTGDIEVLGINTLGVLYICEAGDSINSVSDLKGKTIYASGKGATPEYALNYILEKNGLTPGEDVKIEWKSEHAECVAALSENKDGIAMLPEPFVTTAQLKNGNIRTALDLTKEWEAIGEESGEGGTMVTGVIVARKEFIEKNPEVIEEFLANYKESVEYVNANVEESGKLIGKYGIVPEAAAIKALPKCNIVLIDGDEMKEKLSTYLKVLEEQNAKAIGGKLPGDDFYYKK